MEGSVEFTILPDNPSAARIMPSTSNPSKQHRVLRHHSGRPWIIGGKEQGRFARCHDR
jgi:hypothetical protein